jgi:hypothetical protein
LRIRITSSTTCCRPEHGSIDEASARDPVIEVLEFEPQPTTVVPQSHRDIGAKSAG